MKEHDRAFPGLVSFFNEGGIQRIESGVSGMALKQYAAIHLKVPRSGDAEIDAMIRESRRAEFSGQALAKLVFPIGSVWGSESYEFRQRVSQCFCFADAMLAEWENGVGNGGEV
jgi:hypothetical protein